MPEILLPNNGWRPRGYQQPMWDALEGGTRYISEIAHRRWGKDEVCLHWTATSAHERIGTYWHMLPMAAQARKAIWLAINPHTGIRRIDEAFPHELRKKTLDNEMFIEFKNGSTWQVVGSDNYNSLVGSPPVGLVVSEWALADPAAWAYLRPILLENGGWVIFITTPRGRNHAFKMHEMARKAPETWFAQVSNAVETGRFTAEELERELKEYEAQYGADHGHAMWSQEYMCSFNAANLGSYYGLAMEQAEKEKRIGAVPWDPSIPVHTSWDIGIGDSMAICFWQVGAGQVRMIDHYENQGFGLEHYAKVLQNKPYRYDSHIGPHDLAVRELGSGRSRAEIAADLGIDFTIAPRLTIEDGINATRLLLNRMWVDSTKCEKAINSLLQYHKSWNDKTQDWGDKPAHDWSSHTCDAVRYFAVSTPILSEKEYKTPDRYRRTKHNTGASSWMSA